MQRKVDAVSRGRGLQGVQELAGELLEIDGGQRPARCDGARAVRRHELHIGARVIARAGPGEVLVSGTVKDLVAGSGIDFADRGAHELKGVPGEWRLFAVERCPTQS